MLSKENFKKINDYLWEIPQSLRKDMRVPARIYASLKMLERILKDQAVPQLINGCALPGIAKYGIAMPDCHEGYSVPIGFVGAIRVSDGVISPGACGFDINCLPPNAKILLDNGAYLPIGKMVDSWKRKKVSFVDFPQKDLVATDVIYFLQKHNNPTIYRIVTPSGDTLEATKDHPLQTKEGMREARFLKEEDWVLIYPFKGVVFEEPSAETVITQRDVEKVLLKLGKARKGAAIQQILKTIKEKDILPLKYNSWQMPYLLKILGFILGDGYITLKNGKGIVGFNGKKEDLKTIQADIKKIGFCASFLGRKRRHKINTYYGECKFEAIENSLRASSFGFSALLIALGAPYGAKTQKRYRVPEWIFKCPLWQKRLFLAAFFGAELSKPATLNKNNFYGPNFSISKEVGLMKSAWLFMKDITKLLREFQVEAAPVVEVPNYQHKSKKGKTKALRMQIKGKTENLIRFFETIGYEYNREKHKEACLAANYLRTKTKTAEMRNRARKEIRRLYHKKRDFKKYASILVKKYKSPFISESFLYHSLFKEKDHGVVRKKRVPRLSPSFPSFEEYKAKYGYGTRGLVWNKIRSIEKIPYQNFVYDFTINDSNHNFIANSFVVSNCGMKLLKSSHQEKDIKPFLEKLTEEIYQEVPSGLGKGRRTRLSIDQINRVLEGGAEYVVKRGYGEREDVVNCEAGGRLKWADSSAVSLRAKTRGRNQLGTLGSGNHFLEVQKVEEIFDEKTAQIFGLFKNQIVIMIHCGSRGLGHQVCTDYLREFIPLMLNKYKIKVPDKEFACVPFNSPEGQRYFKAMACAANYAWANRQMITYFIRKAWERVLGKQAGKLSPLYDVAHNIIKKEEYIVEGKKIEVAVHRKGATRAFPPGHSEIPERYKEAGQPVLIPGSMGTASYILVGTKKGEEAFFSTCHGAGRQMSRHQALKTIRGEDVKKKLNQKGIVIKAGSFRGIAEEAPIAYKNVDRVVDAVHNAGISKKVARLLPLAVIKG